MARLITIRRRLISASLSPFSQLSHFQNTHSDERKHTYETPPQGSLAFSFLSGTTQTPFAISRRSFSWWGNGRIPQSNEVEMEQSDCGSASEYPTNVQDSGSAFYSSEIAAGGGEGSAIGWPTPVDGVIAFIDGFHNFTGLPWWLTIVASTLSIRLAILPLIILQLKKMDRINELSPKLPPPVPMPGSGRSLREQYTLFTKQRQAIGCPTLMWTFASLAVQAPCFILWMMAIRRMCLEHHPGFDCGGALWFSDITGCAHGPMGALFPISVAGLHFLNVQISFGRSTDANVSGLVPLIMKYYKIWLEILTVPILFVGFYIPQGSLIYWLTNSFLSAVQQLSFRHPSVHQKLGLRVRPKVPQQVGSLSEINNGMSIDGLSPDELLVLASQHVAKGHQDIALQILRAAVTKDPGKPEVYIALGKIQLSKKLWIEASEHFELAIAKGRNADVLIAAYLGAGVALFSQGRKLEAISYLRKLAAFEEPKEQWSKARYYQGLVTLASVLFQEGEKVEAVHYLGLAANYDPSVKSYLQEWEDNPGH